MFLEFVTTMLNIISFFPEYGYYEKKNPCIKKWSFGKIRMTIFYGTDS